MDRNLGASQVATSLSDEKSFGDLSIIKTSKKSFL
jgi:hypothetical protein